MKQKQLIPNDMDEWQINKVESNIKRGIKQ